jgi:hypothetical protein
MIAVYWLNGADELDAGTSRRRDRNYAPVTITGTDFLM